LMRGPMLWFLKNWRQKIGISNAKYVVMVSVKMDHNIGFPEKPHFSAKENYHNMFCISNALACRLLFTFNDVKECKQKVNIVTHPSRTVSSHFYKWINAANAHEPEGLHIRYTCTWTWVTLHILIAHIYPNPTF
jgi:hypothetical protein